MTTIHFSCLLGPICRIPIWCTCVAFAPLVSLSICVLVQSCGLWKLPTQLFSSATDSSIAFDSNKSKRDDTNIIRKLDWMVDGVKTIQRNLLPSCQESLSSFLLDAKLGRIVHDSRAAALKPFFIAADSVSLLVITTRETICLSDNFIAHVEKLGSAPLTIFNGCLDVESYEFCRSFQSSTTLHLVCLDIHDWLPNYSVELSDATLSVCRYHMIVWVKVILLRQAASWTTHGLLLLDTDIVLHGKLHEWIPRHMKPQASIMMGSEPSGFPNSGTVYATSKSVGFLQAWLEQAGGEAEMKTKTADQGALARLFEKHGSFKEELQLIPTFFIRQCGRSRGKLASHYNCKSKGSKSDRMKHNGMWHPKTERCIHEGNT